jgi:hypothetical protein
MGRRVDTEREPADNGSTGSGDRTPDVTRCRVSVAVSSPSTDHSSRWLLASTDKGIWRSRDPNYPWWLRIKTQSLREDEVALVSTSRVKRRRVLLC